MTPKAVKRSVQFIARQSWFPAIGKRTVPYVDKALYKATRGRFGTMSGSGFTGLLLTTIGRKTGKERSVPLLYVGHEGKYYLTGSNWGQKQHPAWSGNLIANPRATLTIKGKKIPVTARLLVGEDREKIWPVLTTTWPAYDIYTERSGRELRVFELTPSY
ncbi:MAG: nitroreductase family deazaflavin-dependent oxidoreductase [Catenulisporales bacterium]|jgi:deazaflavin-dependent oxidoreductase (nitroreductase family)|nr:nitroreductase family deazaflavin-dependent oxidoreductase [Catenulisporales bacterium]